MRKIIVIFTSFLVMLFGFNDVGASGSKIYVGFSFSNIAVKDENNSILDLSVGFDAIYLNPGEWVKKFSEPQDLDFEYFDDFGHGQIFYVYEIYYDSGKIEYVDEVNLSYEMIVNYRQEPVESVIAYYSYASSVKVNYYLEDGSLLQPSLEIFGRVPYSYVDEDSIPENILEHGFTGDDILIDDVIEGYELISTEGPIGKKFTREDQEINLVYKLKSTDTTEPIDPTDPSGSTDPLDPTEPSRPIDPTLPLEPDSPNSETDNENSSSLDNIEKGDLVADNEKGEYTGSNKNNVTVKPVGKDVLPDTGMTSTIQKSISILGLGLLSVIIGEKRRK